MRVKASYLQVGADTVSEEYGSMSDYALRGLGLTQTTLDMLREKLLADSQTGG